MGWDKVKSYGVGVACVMILVTHTPPVLTDPLKNAVSQMRQGYASTESSTVPESASISEIGSAVVKKLLK